MKDTRYFPLGFRFAGHRVPPWSRHYHGGAWPCTRWKGFF